MTSFRSSPTHCQQTTSRSIKMFWMIRLSVPHVALPWELGSPRMLANKLDKKRSRRVVKKNELCSCSQTKNGHFLAERASDMTSCLGHNFYSKNELLRWFLHDQICNEKSFLLMFLVLVGPVVNENSVQREYQTS